MARRYPNRVGQTSSTTGTGTFDLDGGALDERVTFAASPNIASGDTVKYLAFNATDGWEVGTGTYTDAATDTLSRTLEESSTGSLISFTVEVNIVAVVSEADFDQFARKDTAQTFAQDQTFAGALDTVYTVSGTTPAIDGSNGGIQVWTLTGNSTPTDSMANGETILLMIDDGTAYTVTWTSLVDVWLTDSGSAPTLKTTGYTNVVLTKQGGNVYGFRSGDGG